MRVFLCIAVVSACVLVALGAWADDVKFRVLSGKETGMGPICERWKAEELAAQGGKWQDHGWWPWGLTAVDYDGDGDQDLMPSHHGLPGALLLKNQLVETGKLTFADVTAELGLKARDLPKGMGVQAGTYDFTGDGRLDLIGVRSPCYLSREAGGFDVVGRKGFDTYHPKEIIDITGDGIPDILTVGEEVYSFDAKRGDFVKVKTLIASPTEGLPEALKAELEAKIKDPKNRFLRIVRYAEHDLNCDGVKDMVLQGAGAYGAENLGRYLTAAADGALTDVTAETGLPAEGAPVLVADLTGDGAVDIVVATGKAAGLYVNDGKGRFTVRDGEMKKFLEVLGPYLTRVWPADFDNDGDGDLVMSNPRFGQERVFENTGGGVFKCVLKAEGWDSAPVVIADMNNDGLIDLAIGGPGTHQSADITIYLNETPNAGNWCNVAPRMARPNVFAVGALVEAFRAGEMDKPGALPIVCEKAHPDATPVHVGLGAAKIFDLRVTFPGAKPVVLKGVSAAKELVVTPDGLKGAKP